MIEVGKQERDRSTSRTREKDGATVNARLRRDRTNSPLVRLRAQAMPHYALAGLAASGTVAGWIGPAVATPGTAGATVAAAGAAGAWMWARRRGRQALLAGIGAACWCGWTTAAGMSWDALAVLAVGGYAAALPWWRRHRLADPPEHTLPTVAEVDAMDPARLWAEHVAVSGGPLPDSWLTTPEPTKTGVRYELHTVPGKQTLATAQGVLPRLRSGLRLLRDQDLIVEAHPRLDESILSLTLVQRSPVLTTAQPWPGPGRVYDGEAGVIAAGPYVDGEGTAVWQLARDNRLYGGFAVGSTGSGKSRLLESIALGAAGAAGCVVWFGDPQGGASSPFLAAHADWVARDLDGIRHMLEAARRIKKLRQMENAYHDLEGWTPQQGRRGLLIIVDESHAAMAVDAIRDIATELAREGGKVGIALVLASQVPTLDAFGGSDALRSNVTAGNLVLMRIKSKTAKNILAGVDVDPSAFPRVPGYGFLVDDTGTRRSAPFRGYYLDDDTRDEAAATVTWPELDQAAVAAAGEAYRQRRVQAVTDREELGRLLAALASGRDPELEMPAPVPATAPSPVPVPRFPSVPTIRPTVESTPAGTAVLDRPTAPPVAAPTAVEAVAELLAQGVTAPGEMQARSGYRETAVRQALRELAQQGRARRVRHGVWQPIE